MNGPYFLHHTHVYRLYTLTENQKRARAPSTVHYFLESRENISRSIFKTPLCGSEPCIASGLKNTQMSRFSKVTGPIPLVKSKFHTNYLLILRNINLGLLFYLFYLIFTGTKSLNCPIAMPSPNPNTIITSWTLITFVALDIQVVIYKPNLSSLRFTCCC